MLVRVVLLGLIAVGFSVAPALAASPGFGSGVAAGDVTSSSAILWTRLDRPGTVSARLSRDRARVACRPGAGARRDGGANVLRRARTARAEADNTVRAHVTGLQPATRYFYRFCRGADASRLGRFTTAPPASRERTVTFAVSGDADGTIDPATNAPAFNRFEVYGRMAAEGNDFNVNLGDVVYSDTSVAGVPPALTLDEKWAKYRLNLSYPNLQRLLGAAGTYSQWDDHEFVDDFSVPEHGAALFAAGAKAFLDYTPTVFRSGTGLYRRFRWGANVEIFILDERAFRTAKATGDPACANASTGAPDPLPLLPVSVRTPELLTMLGVPPGPFPAASACAAVLADPGRTMLGAAQLAAFERDVAASTARFKVILNELPIQQIYFQPYDRWEGYAAERAALLRFLRDRVRNVVFMTTDFHANFVNDVRVSGTAGGEPVEETGYHEVVVGPVALKTFAVDTVLKTGQPGAPGAILALFRARRPAGLGMSCAALDTFSYAQVRVTSRALTVELKDGAGNPVREQNGRACRPLTVRAA